jgi:HrpA-like RNA helicase
MMRARDVRSQLLNMCKRVGVDVDAAGHDDEAQHFSNREAQGTLDAPAPSAGPAVSPLDVRLRKAIASGFFFNCAKLETDGSYRTVKQRQQVFIHPSSCLCPKRVEKGPRGGKPSEVDTRSAPPPQWVVYFELVRTSKDYMRNVIAVEHDWLRKVAPHYFRAEEVRQGKNVNVKAKMGAARSK